MAALFASGNKSSKNLFALQKGLLKSVGISLEETQSLSYRLYSSTVLFLMLTIPFVQIRTAIIYISDIQVVSEIVMYPLFIVTVIMKSLIIKKNKKLLRCLLLQLEVNESFPSLELGGRVGLEWVKNCTEMANKLVRGCAIMVGSVIIILPIVTFGMSLSAADCHDWQYTFGPILNVTCTSYVYPISIYQIICLSYSGFIYVFIYCLLLSVMMHIRCHFKILQYVLKKMIDYAANLALKNEDISSDNLLSCGIPWKYLHLALREIVLYHNSILNIAEEFKNIYSPILLTLVIGDIFLLAFTMNLTLGCPKESVQCTRGILCYWILIGLLFVVCYWGEMVHSESLMVAHACGDVNFIATDTKFQKSFVLVMKRAQKPIVFTAGGFMDLSLDSFTQILRSSYSYFMLLYNARSN